MTQNAADAATKHSDRYLRTKEVAAWLGVSEATVRRWRRKGLPSYKIAQTVLYKAVEVEEWMEGRQIAE